MILTCPNFRIPNSTFVFLEYLFLPVAFTSPLDDRMLAFTTLLRGEDTFVVFSKFVFFTN